MATKLSRCGLSISVRLTGVTDSKPRDSPSPYEGLQIASQLLMADGGKTVSRPIRSFERNDAGMIPALRALRLPRFIMKIYAWYLRYIRQDSIYAGLVENFFEKTVSEYYGLIAQREDYRARWFKVWRGVQVDGSLGDDGIDFILTVPNALPAVPHRGMRHGWKACGYTFIFNLVRHRLNFCHGTLNLADVSLITVQASCQSLGSVRTATCSHRRSVRETQSRGRIIKCTMHPRWRDCLSVYRWLANAWTKNEYWRR